MDGVLRFVKCALAVFRLAHMLWWENGPFDIFDWLRSKVGIRWAITEEYQGGWGYSSSGWHSPEVLEGRTSNGSFLAELLNCPLCLSIWIALPVMVAYRLRRQMLDAVVDWLALSGVALLLFGWERDE